MSVAVDNSEPIDNNPSFSEARIASSLGIGFYTIGPCGEELLGAVALNLRATDSTALHYRHVATSVTRQLLIGKKVSEIATARARGYTCSSLDPVTGGKHCAIGGSSYDYLVTSTLASQATPAVGRALAVALSNILLSTRRNVSCTNLSSTISSSSSSLSSTNVHLESGLRLNFHSSRSNSFPITNVERDSANTQPSEVHFKTKFPKDSISYVSFGDGSVNNSHFLSALNLAKYSQHRGIKVRAYTYFYMVLIVF